jgi:NADH-quinone oxidoreductase subunit J
MAVEVIHIATAALLLVSAYITVETKDLVRSAIAFSIMAVILAVIFYLLNAPLVAVFQLAIYAGAITVLFLAAIHTLRRGSA